MFIGIVRLVPPLASFILTQPRIEQAVLASRSVKRARIHCKGRCEGLVKCRKHECVWRDDEIATLAISTPGWVGVVWGDMRSCQSRKERKCLAVAPLTPC